MTRFLPWLPALAALAFRLLHLDDVQFVSPDGATYLRFDLLVFTQRLPLYPILVHTISVRGIGELLAGKLVASCCAAGAIYVMTLIAAELGFEKTRTWLAAIPLAVDPLFTLQTIQPLTEGTFALCVALATWFLLRMRRADRALDLFGLIFFAGLSALTRAEGLIFIPLLFWSAIRFGRANSWRGASCAILPALFPWLLIVIWQLAIVRHAGYLGEFGAGVATITAGRVLRNAALHLKSVAFHLQIVGLIPTAVGAAILFRGRFVAEVRRVNFVLAYLLVATWAALSIHWYFDLRFATPLALWLSIPAAIGWRRILSAGRVERRLGQSLLVALVLAWLVLSSSLAQGVGALGSDITQAAKTAATLVPNSPLLSDEQAMTSYYAGRLAMLYRPEMPFRRAALVLHDRYTDLQAERRRLRRDYEIREVADVMGQGSTGVAWRAVVWLISRRPGNPAAAVLEAPANAPDG